MYAYAPCQAAGCCDLLTVAGWGDMPCRSTGAVNLSHKSFRFEGLCGPPALETDAAACGLRLWRRERRRRARGRTASKESRSLLPCFCLELNSEGMQADRPARWEPPRWTRSPLRALAGFVRTVAAGRILLPWECDCIPSATLRQVCEVVVPCTSGTPPRASCFTTQDEQ